MRTSSALFSSLYACDMYIQRRTDCGIKALQSRLNLYHGGGGGGGGIRGRLPNKGLILQVARILFPWYCALVLYDRTNTDFSCCPALMADWSSEIKSPYTER